MKCGQALHTLPMIRPKSLKSTMLLRSSYLHPSHHAWYYSSRYPLSPAPHPLLPTEAYRSQGHFQLDHVQCKALHTKTMLRFGVCLEASPVPLPGTCRPTLPPAGSMVLAICMHALQMYSSQRHVFVVNLGRSKLACMYNQHLSSPY